MLVSRGVCIQGGYIFEGSLYWGFDGMQVFLFLN